MNRIENLHSNVFSQRNVELFEKNIMFLAVGGFIIHLDDMGKYINNDEFEFEFFIVYKIFKSVVEYELSLEIFDSVLLIY